MRDAVFRCAVESLSDLQKRLGVPAALFDILSGYSTDLLSPTVLIPWLLGMVFGVFVGSTPGLTATMAVALIVPLSFQLQNETAGLAMIIGVSFTAIFAGDIPATYLRIPGTPASTAATLDAHALAKQGRAAEALQTNLLCSASGGLIGVVALMVIGPRLAKLALRFDDYEYFWLMLLGLVFCIVVSQGSLWRATLAAVLGLLFAMVGLDQVGNTPRFTFSGVPALGDLLGGLNFIPAMIGLFGLTEALRWSSVTDNDRIQDPNRPWKLPLTAARNVGGHSVTLLSSATVGTLIGALPGAGADIAAWAAYGIRQRIRRKGELFGKGEVAGIVAPTSANNAAVAGAWIPALVFGLPGDSVTAIVIGAFTVYNIVPGHEAFADESSGVPALLRIALVTQFLLIPAGWLGIRCFDAAMKLPRSVIRSSVIVFSLVGAYAVSNSLFDVWVMIAFGFLGLFLDWQRIPATPLILGMILGGNVEGYLRKGMIASQGDLSPFFTRPDSMILVSLLLIVVVGRLCGTILLRGRTVSSAAGTEEMADR